MWHHHGKQQAITLLSYGSFTLAACSPLNTAVRVLRRNVSTEHFSCHCLRVFALAKTSALLVHSHHCFVCTLCLISLKTLPRASDHSCVCLFQRVPCSCVTSLISLCHLSCVFSYVFHLHMSTSISVEAVSTMVWPRNETGGLSGVGQISNRGPIMIVLSVLNLLIPSNQLWFIFLPFTANHLMTANMYRRYGSHFLWFVINS